MGTIDANSAARWLARPVALASLLVAASAGAQDGAWNFQPRIASEVTWTDNVGLDPDVAAEEQTALVITPGFNLTRESQRLDLNVDYRLQSRFYDEDQLDEIDHFLSASGTATLYSDSLFVDFRSNVTQQIVDPQQRVSISTVSGAENRTEVASTHLTPYWAGDVGDFAQGRVSYRYGLVEYNDPNVRDSKEQVAELSLSGNPKLKGLNWGLSHVDSRTRYDVLGPDSGPDEIDVARSSLTLTYPLTPKARLVVVGGVDDNNFTFAGPSDIDGKFWQLGLSGLVGRFTTYEVRAGESFYGGSYFATIDRTGRVLNLRVEYDELATTVGQEQLDYLNFLNYLSQVAGLELNINSPDLYVRKRLTGTADLRLAKTNVEVRIYTETRDYLDQFAVDDDDGVFGVTLRGSWRAAERTNLEADINWRSFDLRATPTRAKETPEDTIARLRLRRELGAGVDLTFELAHNRRAGANSSLREYEENIVSVGIGKTF